MNAHVSHPYDRDRRPLSSVAAALRARAPPPDDRLLRARLRHLVGHAAGPVRAAGAAGGTGDPAADARPDARGAGHGRRVLEGPAGRRRLLARVRIWRVARRWYLFVLVGIPVVCVLAALVLPGAFVGLGDQSAAKLVIEFLVFLVVGFFSGPLFEEPGWRGFALPRLQVQMGALRGTLVLGALWAAWHLPQYLVPEWADQNGGLDPTLVATFLLMVVAIAPVMTWVFNHTRGSLLLVMLAHASINAVAGAPSSWRPRLSTWACWPLAPCRSCLIVVTRGRLGYVPPKDSPDGRRRAGSSRSRSRMGTSARSGYHGGMCSGAWRRRPDARHALHARRRSASYAAGPRRTRRRPAPR